MTGRIKEPREDDTVRLKSFDDFELTLGDLMRGERATKGKSLLDVQREIKIKAEYIAGIEDADLSVFETPGFINGYVKSYARYLGMNADWVYARFCQESGFSHVDGLEATVYTKVGRGTRPTVKRKPADAKDAILARSPLSAAPQPGMFHGLEASAVMSLAVLCVLIAGLGYGGWSLLQEIQRVTLSPVEAPLTVALSPGETVENSGLSIDNAAPTPAALERLYRPKALDTPVLVPRDGPIAMLDPDGQGVFAPHAPEPVLALAPVADEAGPELADADAGPEVQVVAAAVPEVVLFARRPAWVRVRGSDGSVLLEKIMEQGERYVLPKTETPPTLRAGNSGSVYFAVNGATLGPAGKGTSVAKNVVLSADALSTAYAVADLGEDPELARLAELVLEPDTPTVD
ncbi:MAG: helix-turn-helix domain-containing protein [Rhodobacteraceae bacterium]|nr:helix-turn-helix domain-containing protein [Paracoccaceae bacterium]